MATRRALPLPDATESIYVKEIVALAALALTACAAAPPAPVDVSPAPAAAQSAAPPQTAPASQTAPPAQNDPARAARVAAPSDGLRDLGAMTFGCPKAGLNAAAREAAKAPAQGTYQFSYFKLVNDSHHSTYEVHFKSNYHGEPDLRYCVSVYCQQGWGPEKTSVLVTPIDNRHRPAKAGAGAMAHGAADCADQRTRTKRRSK